VNMQDGVSEVTHIESIEFYNNLKLAKRRVWYFGMIITPAVSR